MWPCLGSTTFIEMIQLKSGNDHDFYWFLPSLPTFLLVFFSLFWDKFSYSSVWFGTSYIRRACNPIWLLSFRNWQTWEMRIHVEQCHVMMEAEREDFGNQRMLRLPGKHEKLVEIFPLQPCQGLDPGFWGCKLWGNTFVLLKWQRTWFFITVAL